MTKFHSLLECFAEYLAAFKHDMTVALEDQARSDERQAHWAEETRKALSEILDSKADSFNAASA